MRFNFGLSNCGKSKDLSPVSLPRSVSKRGLDDFYISRQHPSIFCAKAIFPRDPGNWI